MALPDTEQLELQDIFIHRWVTQQMFVSIWAEFWLNMDHVKNIVC